MKVKKLLKNIISWVVYLTILAGLIYGIPKTLAYFLETPHPIASITSGSMWPVLKKGDLVLIKGMKNKKELEVGDIVVYENSRGFTIHRAVALKENILITKGDANNTNDSPVSYEQIIGRAVELKNKPLRLPYLGLISVFVSKYKNS